jgi:hypothetical protein
MTPSNLDWILTQLDLGNPAPGWCLAKDPPVGFVGLVRADDGKGWMRRIPDGPWLETPRVEAPPTTRSR